MEKAIKQIVCTVLIVLMLSSCAQVKVIDSRMNVDGEVRATSIFQYSFLTMNPLGNKRLDRDLSKFNGQLAAELKKNKFNVVAEEAQAVALKNDLPVNSVEFHAGATGYYGSSYSGTKTIPVKDVIASNSAREKALNISHRLILFPAVSTFHGDVASVTGDVKWSLQDVRSGEMVAEGSVHYIADVRGFPGDDMAAQLVQELVKLGVHGGDQGQG
jgi:hypothetical protein